MPPVAGQHEAVADVGVVEPMNSMPSWASSSAEHRGRLGPERLERPRLGRHERQLDAVDPRAEDVTRGHHRQLVERQTPRHGARHDERNALGVAFLQVGEQPGERLGCAFGAERDGVRGTPAPAVLRPRSAESRRRASSPVAVSHGPRLRVDLAERVADQLSRRSRARRRRADGAPRARGRTARQPPSAGTRNRAREPAASRAGDRPPVRAARSAPPGRRRRLRRSGCAAAVRSTARSWNEARSAPPALHRSAARGVRGEARGAGP